MEPLVYLEMKRGEEQSVCELVEHVFIDFVTPDYEQEGIAEFFRFANPSAMTERIDAGGFVLVARQAEKLVGRLRSNSKKLTRALERITHSLQYPA